MERSDADQVTPEESGVSLREAARRLGCSVDTVQRRLKAGRLRGRKQVEANGTERWEVYLPDDLASVRPKRPAVPEDVVYPGPPDPRLEAEQLKDRIAFLEAELEARRSEVAAAQEIARLLIERRAPLALPAPRQPDAEHWWLRLGRAIRALTPE